MGGGSSSPGNLGKAVPFVSVEAGETLRSEVQGLVPGDVHSFYPTVLITYATGSRKCGSGTAAAAAASVTDERPLMHDAAGCGPGMLYVAELARRLHASGVPCFTGMHVPAGVDWHCFLEKLCGRWSHCRLLLVVVTPALYSSRPCLQEIATALKNGVKILPLLFEGPVPRKEAQWAMVEKSDEEGKLTAKTPSTEWLLL